LPRVRCRTCAYGVLRLSSLFCRFWRFSHQISYCRYCFCPSQRCWSLGGPSLFVFTPQ